MSARHYKHDHLSICLILMTALVPVGYADNAAPVVSVHFSGNASFLWPDAGPRYQVIVSDREDGDTIAGTLAPGRVSVVLEPLHQAIGDFRPALAEAAQSGPARRGKALIGKSDCVLCHTETAEGPSIIPAYETIAAAYQDSAELVERLAAKIVSGGSGVWGSTPMTPHPALSLADARAMVEYVLSLDAPGRARKPLPLGGVLPAQPAAAGANARYVFWAAYTDEGAAGSPPRSGYIARELRTPLVAAVDNDGSRGMEVQTTGNEEAALLVRAPGAYLRIAAVDLSGIRALRLQLGAAASPARGAAVEVRLDQADGALRGRAGPAACAADDAGAELVARIEPTRGVHDVYLVFPSPDLDADTAVAVKAIRFER